MIAADGTDVIEEVTTTSTRLAPLWLFFALGLGLGVAFKLALKRV